MNIQNISSLPDFIDKFIKFNHDKLIEIYDEGINFHTEGLLYFQCDKEENNLERFLNNISISIFFNFLIEAEIVPQFVNIPPNHL